MTSERQRLSERRDVVARDLEELAAQVAEGEVDAATAERLQSAYRAELASLDAAVRDLPAVSTPTVQSSTTQRAAGDENARSTRRMIVGTVIIVAALSVAIGLAARDTETVDAGPVAASPGELTVDPAEVSNEQLEAVVAANPDINGMRMALADRYFAAGDYGPALDHYLYIADNDPTPVEAGRALARVGWMAYLTELPDEADQYLRASLDLDPTNTEARLFIGFVTLYGLGDSESAIPMLEAARELPNLSDDVIAQIDEALEEARRGGTP